MKDISFISEIICTNPEERKVRGNTAGLFLD